MGSLIVRVCNALRRPLDDEIDVIVVSSQSDVTAASIRNARAAVPIRFERLIEGQPYLVRVFPKRHRPVAQFVSAGPDAQPAFVQLHCPIDPEKVSTVNFPPYSALDRQLQRVLEASALDGMRGAGEMIYTGLSNTRRAGLLNLFTKMTNVTFRLAGGSELGAPLGGDDSRTIWSFVDRLFDVRDDRVFADVQPQLHELINAAVSADVFRAVSGSLHEPPTGFGHAGSFKTAEPYGNLQLTFFTTGTSPRRFKVDADIDDAAGLGHAFQVIRNFITHGTTHPYDIHEILAFRHQTALPYDLA